MSPVHYMPVEVHFRPSGKWWIGECPNLGVITQGETFERANENLQEALRAFLTSCLERGTLEEVLRQSGFTKKQIIAVSHDAKEHLKYSPVKQRLNACHA